MPWVHSKADFNLVDMVEDLPILPCKALEIGCGTGTDALWLASRGFEVTGVDVVQIPIDLARNEAANININCQFLVHDFLLDDIEGGPFQFVFDRGYFHSYKTNTKRKQLAGKVADSLEKGGLWLTLAGSCDSPPREEGPPMISAKNIVDSVEPFFEIVLLKSSVFGSESEVPANIWVGLMRKR